MMKMSFLVLGLLGHALASPVFAAESPAGRIERVDGHKTVEIHSQGPTGNRQALAQNAIHEGDHILTAPGQTVFIKLNDGTDVVVAPESEMVIEEWGIKNDVPSNMLGVLRGLIYSLIGRKYAPEHPFLVTTQSMVMGIRGTEFVVQVDSDETRLHTLEGTIGAAKSVQEYLKGKGVQNVGAGNMLAARGTAALTPAVPYDHAALKEELTKHAPALQKYLSSKSAKPDQKHI